MANPSTGHLKISVRTAAQLFNSLDPSPFYEKDLDADAEQYLVSWAEEFGRHAELELSVHLKEVPEAPEPERWIPQAIHGHFRERARLTRAEFHQLMRLGRTSLLVGVSFLATCLLLASEFAGTTGSPGVLPWFVRESFTIAGWVAMWRPLQIYLYDWWPVLRREQIYQRMSRMPVSVHVGHVERG